MKKLLIFLFFCSVLNNSIFGQVTIGVVADVQYALAPERLGRHYDKGPELLGEAVDQFNKTDGLAFAIDLGDMTDRRYQDYVDLAAVKAELKAEWYNVYGNHDFALAKTERDLQDIARLRGMKKPYYSIVQGGIRFIFLNCSDIALHSSIEGSPERKRAEQWLEDLNCLKSVAAKNFNGAISFKQLVWLDKELAKADRKGQAAIICCHMLIVPFDRTESLWNGMEVAHILESHPSAKAVFCGHAHNGGYQERNGVHYVNFRGMVNGDNNRFAVVSIDPARRTIEIDGFGDEPDRSLKTK